MLRSTLRGIVLNPIQKKNLIIGSMWAAETMEVELVCNRGLIWMA